LDADALVVGVGGGFHRGNFGSFVGGKATCVTLGTTDLKSPARIRTHGGVGSPGRKKEGGSDKKKQLNGRTFECSV